MQVILVIFVLCNCVLSEQSLTFSRSKKELVISDTIDSSVGDLTYSFSIDTDDQDTVLVRTTLATNVADLSQPVVFVVKQDGIINHWHVPDNDFKSNFSSRTLCPPAEGMRSMNISLTVSTSGERRIPFTVVLRRASYLLILDPKVPLPHREQLTVSPTSPRVFSLQLRDDRRYLVKVRSKSQSVCSTVTVRPDDACPQSPLPYTESQMIFGSRAQHQVMLDKAAIHVNTDLFSPETNVINIFIVAKVDNVDCNPMTEGTAHVTEDTKNHGFERRVDMELSVEVVPDDISVSVFSVLGLYLGGGILAVLLHCIFYGRDR